MENEGMADGAEAGDDSVRFEDLTVDDDLPLIDRIVRYCHSPVALQRLVHVKMLAEASELAGYVYSVSKVILERSSSVGCRWVGRQFENDCKARPLTHLLRLFLITIHCIA